MRTAEQRRAYHKEYNRKYEIENKDKIRERKKEWHIKNREKRKEYYIKNKDLVKERKKKYYIENKERLLKITKEYYEKDRERWSEYHKKRRQENKEKIKLHKQAYKANLKDKSIKLTPRTIQLVYEDNIKKYGTLTCYLCLEPIKFGEDNLEHKTPISRGGTNAYENLAIAHGFCNNKKHKKTYEEYCKKGETDEN